MGSQAPSPAPPMAQPAGNYQAFVSPNSSPLLYTHWQAPAWTRPPPLASGPRSPQLGSGGGHGGQSRHPSIPHSSISSITSGSSDTSDYKIPALPYPSRSKPQSARGHFELSQSGPPQAIHGTSPLTNWPEMDERRQVVIQYIPPDDDVVEEREDHAVWILCWLSCLDPFHSLFSCTFSVFALLALILYWPLRLFRKGDTFSTVLIRTIAPVFRNQLRLIYAPSAKNAHEFDFSALRLMLVHLALPIVSFAIAFFSWVAAVFWLFTLLMGNPDGTEKRDDGRATVLGARNYLERYLLSALKNDQ